MRAITRPLDKNVDLNDVAGDDGLLFVRDGVGVASRGIARRIDVEEAKASLASIRAS
jgi:hypothetical protein